MYNLNYAMQFKKNKDKQTNIKKSVIRGITQIGHIFIRKLRTFGQQKQRIS